MKPLKHLSIFFGILLLMLSSCSNESANVTLYFEHQVDGIDLEIYSMNYTNNVGNNYDVRLLKYIISNIELINDKGEIFELDEIHYVDIENTNTLSLNNTFSIPCGNYESLNFTFGLDEEMNMSNEHIAESFHNSMAWPNQMGGGYHYMRLEGAYLNQQNEQNFYLTHTGATSGVPRHINYSIPLNLHAKEKEDYQLNLVMNINNWYSNPNTYNFEDYNDGIMGNPEAQQLLHENGYNVFNVEEYNLNLSN